jgi:hypothetical protein
MNGSKFVNTLVSAAGQIVAVWKANPTFTMGSVTQAQFEAAIKAAADSHGAVEDGRTDLTGRLDNRDDEVKALSDLVTRARSGLRAQFGPDSPQYAQGGGKRRSERKPPRRRPKSDDGNGGPAK